MTDHECCGCICAVCEDGHETTGGMHSWECMTNMYERYNRAMATEQPADDGEKTRMQWYRKRAKAEWQEDGSVEIDDDAKVSLGDDKGAYVQAWVWVDAG